MVDPNGRMSVAEIKQVVNEAVKGVLDPMDAMIALRAKFPTAKIVWVRTLGGLQWGVWLQPYPNSEQYSFVCDRNQ